MKNTKGTLCASLFPHRGNAVGIWAVALLLGVFAMWTSAFAASVVVKLRSSAARQEKAAALARRTGASSTRALLLQGTYVLDSPQPRTKMLALMKADPDVVYAAPLRRLELAERIPNDPLFVNQWHLRNTGQSGGTIGADIRATYAWDITTGSAHTVIAIIDSGIEASHPDLSGRLWTNPGEIADNGIDDDGNGFVDDVHGWNFYASSPNVGPTLSHGTNVAGLAGAATNNGIGVAGVDWNARLMPVVIFSPEGFATDADAADAIVYACDNGARIINASWGSPGFSPVIADAVAYAQQKGVLVCAAAGNYNFDSDEHPFYPAAGSCDALIAVGGSTNRDDWIYNYGQRTVHIVAPASSLYQARYPSTYGYGSGTSYATPLVAGTAALLLAFDSSLSTQQLKFRLIASAVKPARLAGRSVGGGRLDAYSALCTTRDEGTPTTVTLELFHVGMHGAILRVPPPASPSLHYGSLLQLKTAGEPFTTARYESLPDERIVPIPDNQAIVFVVNNLEPETSYWAGIRAFDRAGTPGGIQAVPFTTRRAPTIFLDTCDTTSALWVANGFTLAPGDTHSGILCWQESPDGNYAPGTTATLTGGPFDIRSLARPRLSFYLEHFFPSRLGEGDRLEVRVSADGGNTWQTLRRFRATVSPPRRFSLPLDEFSGTDSLWIQFAFVADSNSYTDDGVYLDDIAIEEGLGDVPFADEVIIESYDFFGQETQASAFAQSPQWSTAYGKSTAPKLEGSAALSVDAGTTSAIASFQPFIPISGVYEIFVTHGSSASAEGVTWRIHHADGITVVNSSQNSVNANQWLSLGKYRLLYGRSSAIGSVELDAGTASGGKVFADAVRFILCEPEQESSSVRQWTLYE